MFPTLSCLYVDELKYTGNVPPRVLGLFNGDNSSSLNYITIIRVTSRRPVMHLYFAIHRRFLPVLDHLLMLLLTVEMYEWVAFGTKPNTDVFLQLNISVSDHCGDQIVNGSFRMDFFLFFFFGPQCIFSSQSSNKLFQLLLSHFHRSVNT